MSTANFSYKNILAVAPDFNFYHKCDEEDCDFNCEKDGSYIDFDEIGYESWKEDLKFDLMAIGYDYYGGKLFYTLEDKNGEVYKEIEVLFNTGYYDGHNVDYEIEDFEDDVVDAEALDKKLEEVIAQTREIILKHTTEYIKVASFSNGEAVYEKA